MHKYNLAGHKGSVLCVESGPVSKKDKEAAAPRPLLLSGSDDSTCRLWDLRTRKPCRCMMGCFDKQPVNSVAFIPGDPRTVLAAAGRCVFSFDLRKESVVLFKAERKLGPTKDDINQVSVSRQGFVAACDDSGGVRVWEDLNGESMMTAEGGHSNICMSVSFRPRRKWELVSAAMEMDSAIILWDLSRKRVMQTLSNRFGAGDAKKGQLVNPPFVNSISFSRDGTVLAAALGSGEIGLYSLAKKSKCTIGCIEAHTASVSQTLFPAFGAEDLLVSAGTDRKAFLWRLDAKRVGRAKSRATSDGPLAKAVLQIGLDEKPNWVTSTSQGGPTICVADCSEVIKCYGLGSL